MFEVAGGIILAWLVIDYVLPWMKRQWDDNPWQIIFCMVVVPLICWGIFSK